MTLQQCTTCRFASFRHMFKVALRPDFIYDHRLQRQYSQLNTLLRKCNKTSQLPAFVSRLSSTLKYSRLFCTNSYLEEMLEGHPDENIEELLRRDEKYQEYVREYFSIPNTGQRVFLIQPNVKRGPQRSLSSITSQLEESVALIQTLPNWKVVGKKIVATKSPDSKPVFGKGNFAALTSEIHNCPAVTAIFISLNMLNTLQWTYLQNVWKIPVYDRYNIVLQIFKEYAKTKEVKLQVALAEIPYIRSRLPSVHGGSLSITAGGTKHTGGTTPMYLEQRFKYLQDWELKLKKALKKVRKQRAIVRQNRLKKQIPIVAVVGYTNAGKTSIIKALTADAKLQPVDQLFATLDVTAHAGVLPNHMTVIYIDTVGFISNIPTTLIEAFAATLEDAVIADVVIHVRDISHEDTTAQSMNVYNTLKGMINPQKLENMIEVKNKVDLLLCRENLESQSERKCIYTNASSGVGVGKLKHCIQEAILNNSNWKQRKFRINMGSSLFQWLQQEASIVSAVPDATKENLIVTVVITDSTYHRFKAEFKKQRKKYLQATIDVTA
ncbi:putative GTP-binding protein 6 [Octopus bimaculoides]|uniref:Hflx-type G domain-containing protein n=1 Tax=Octopus bimaculoides TaxID=37653 RepID=A0A0L8HFG0_OCTBM|nr:putative GTP-binding protein 6 [Octopus bimaculoides]|eukprot:XP_014772769.1 PREDICTED: putative GTP-binding protein 6 [Octopus bimaculoides]